MGTATVVFLIIGGVSVAILALGVIGTEVLQFGHPDVDGPVSLEAVAGFAGAVGFGAAIASELLGASGGCPARCATWPPTPPPPAAT